MATSAAEFAITTTFTPPATCTQDLLTQLPSPLYYIYLNYPNPVPETTITDCYPSQFISSYLSQQSNTATPLAPIEPFICPVGYTEVTASPSATGYLACCPSGFALAPPSSVIATRPAYGGTCYSDISTVLVTAYGPDSVTATSTFVQPTGAQAYALVMEGYASTTTSSSSTSSTASSGAVASSTASSASTSSATAAPVSHSTSHAGAIAGGVVGGLALLAIILGLILFLLRRSKNSRKPADHGTADELGGGAYNNGNGQHGHMDEKKVDPGNSRPPLAEMGGSGSYAMEKDGTTSAAELDGRPNMVHQASELEGSERGEQT